MMLREPWRTRLLFVSFALNLLLVPIAASHLWMRRPPLTPGLPRTEMLINHMAQDLPAADAAVLRDVMETHVPDIEAARARMLAARRAMSRMIGKAPYDAAAVQGAMVQWQTAWRTWSDALGGGMLDALPHLSDEGREALASQGRRPE